MPHCCQSHTVQLWLAFLLICVAYTGADILVFSSLANHEMEGEFVDSPGNLKFPIPHEGIRGLIVYADPPEACTDISAPPNIPNPFENWIVLIARFNCTFEDKILNAEKAGYNAVIIHNVNSDDIVQMSVKDESKISIVAVFVSEITGILLRNNYSFDQSFFVVINDGQPFNINTHLLLPFAIVVGICFLVMVIFMVVKCLKDRRRQRRHRLPNSSLKKIPTHKYTKGDPYETCAICLDDYTEGEKLRVLPCAHAYHTKCIDPWLTKNRRVCPVCKRKVFAADEHVTDSESDTDADDSTPLIRDSHQGTQGGTFTTQSRNPFTRARGNQNRRESSNSSSSSTSSSSSGGLFGTSDEGEHVYNEESSAAAEFMVSDSHSINGAPADLERSASSTKPHTVNLSADIQEPPAVHITPTRNPRVLVNPVAPNSGHPILVPANPLPIPTILTDDHGRNDFIA